MPLARRAARRPGRHPGRFLRDLPRRRPLLPAGGGDARQGPLAPVRADRSHAAELHGLSRRSVAFAQALRSQGSDAADRPLDGGPGSAKTESVPAAQGKVIVLAAEFLKSATDARGWPPPGPPELAFCGRSNVGKSSALNALAARKSLARVSRTPGRTRLINFFDVRAAEKTRSGGRGPEHRVVFADLPGYGFASGPREEREGWRAMIEEYLTGREALSALVVLVDGELGAQPSDVEMVRWGESLDHRV